MRSSNLAIVFVDIAGFSERTGQQSRAQSAEWLHRYEELLLPLVRAFSGRRVKSLGDAYLCTFVSPTNALLFGMAAQDRMYAYNQEAPRDERIEIRVAVNVGEVREHRRDIFGEPVNIAARLEGITPIGDVWFSEAAYLAMTKSEVPTREVGVKELRGIQDPVRIYRIPRGTEYRLEGGRDQDSGDIQTTQYPYNGLGLKRAEEQGWVMSLADVQGRVKHASVLAAGGLAVILGRMLDGMGRALRRLPVKSIAVVGGIVLAVFLVVLLWPVGPYGEVESALDDGRPQRALALLERHPKRNKRAGRLLRARALLRLKEPKVARAQEILLAAVEKDPKLLEDGDVLDDLVAALNRRHAEKVMKLIEEQPGKSIKSRLLKASRSPRYWLRWNSIRLLEKMGNVGEVDVVYAYIQDLRFAGSCSTRKLAVRKLGALGDRRALKYLQEAKKKSFLENLCMGAALDDAIREIEK